MERIGKYQIIRELGKGATATVYLAQDPDRRFPVAIKSVNDGAGLSRRLRKLFMVEAQLARRLQHPSIVGIYDAVVEDEAAYVVMEYVQGTTLESYCTVDKLLPIEQALRIIFKCCMALDYAFRKGVIHRDIKPANIMLVGEDEPKIMDFGLAIDLDPDNNDSTQLVGVGSPAYMSPEQIRGYPLNQQTDLFSLGVVLYELLTGRQPFRARNRSGLIYKLINSDPVPPSQLRPLLPAYLDRVVMKALEKDTPSRYRNGAEMGKDLTGVMFQIRKDVPDTTDHGQAERFAILRALRFFTRFDDLELWEALHFCKDTAVAAQAPITREGEPANRFYVIAEGRAKVMVGNRPVSVLGPGDCFGEAAFVEGEGGTHRETVAAIDALKLVEVSRAALALASEGCRENFQQAFIGALGERLRAANKRLAAAGSQSSPAGRPSRSGRPVQA